MLLCKFCVVALLNCNHRKLGENPTQERCCMERAALHDKLMVYQSLGDPGRRRVCDESRVRIHLQGR